MTTLREGELAELIKLSDGGLKGSPKPRRVVNCSFGPGWVGIDDRPENEWALAELAKIRARPVN